MTDLLYTEKDLVTSLKDYIKAEENKLEQIKRCVCAYSYTHGLIHTCTHVQYIKNRIVHVKSTLRKVSV